MATKRIELDLFGNFWDFIGEYSGEIRIFCESRNVWEYINDDGETIELKVISNNPAKDTLIFEISDRIQNGVFNDVAMFIIKKNIDEAFENKRG